MTETQKTITDWGVGQFGEGTPLTTLLRCMMEGMELAIALAYGVNRELIEDEFADVDIILDQAFELSGISAERRQELKDAKMMINRARVWGRTATGRAQHIEDSDND